jgi:hypothetical protein
MPPGGGWKEQAAPEGPARRLSKRKKTTDTVMLQPEILGIFIPIIAIVMGIGIGMLALVLKYRKRKEMFALYHQERMAAIEKGIELPPLPEAFFAEESEAPRAPSPHRHLLVGLILTLFGLSLMLALYATFANLFLWGLIPAAPGFAFLIYYFAVGRKEAQAIEAAAKAKAAERNLP